jgi:hypothetical protein
MMTNDGIDPLSVIQGRGFRWPPVQASPRVSARIFSSAVQQFPLRKLSNLLSSAPAR